MLTIDTSRELMFPKLSMEEIDRLRWFGTVRRYAAGELLCATADISPGMLVILSGSVAISGREGLGHVFPIIEQGLGGFLAEVGQLSGRKESAFRAWTDRAARKDFCNRICQVQMLGSHAPLLICPGRATGRARTCVLDAAAAEQQRLDPQRFEGAASWERVAFRLRWEPPRGFPAGGRSR